MASTTTRGYPFPENTDPADVPYDVEQLAVAVNNSPGITSYTQTEINNLAAGMKWAGRIVWNSTTSTLQRSDGSTFSDLALSSAVPALSSSTPATTALTGSAGSASTASKSDHVHALHSFGTPISFTPTVSGTGWALGNALHDCIYIQIGKLIHISVWIEWGTTSTFGTESLMIASLPQSAYSNDGITAMGNVMCVRGTSRYGGLAQFNTSTSCYLRMGNPGNPLVNVNNTVPFAWASGDKIFLSAVYEGAT